MGDRQSRAEVSQVRSDARKRGRRPWIEQHLQRRGGERASEEKLQRDVHVSIIEASRRPSERERSKDALFRNDCGRNAFGSAPPLIPF